MSDGLTAIVCSRLQVDGDHLRDRTIRSPRLAFARQVWTYLLVKYGLTTQAVCETTGQHPSTVENAYQIIESARESQVLDAMLDAMLEEMGSEDEY